MYLTDICKTKDDQSGGAIAGAVCKFPFIYFGNTYNGCIRYGSKDEHVHSWCPTALDQHGVYVTGQKDWGICSDVCNDHVD